jgi:hypothetical protein
MDKSRAKNSVEKLAMVLEKTIIMNPVINAMANILTSNKSPIISTFRIAVKNR